MEQAEEKKSILGQLEAFSVVVADTGDLGAIRRHRPQDATTNPSLVLRAVAADDRSDEVVELVREAAAYARGKGLDSPSQREFFVLRVMANFGRAILKIIPGRVSTEVDARLSFDSQKTIDSAKALISMYEELGVERERVLVKIAATWEGLQAAGELEKQGIRCNMTLIFGLPQAVVAASNNVQLVSPFVGRIFDWHQKNATTKTSPDPGVASVRCIYNYYKKFDHKTEVMAASFRHREQILELAGCDLLTISPVLLAELDGASGKLESVLSHEQAKNSPLEAMNLDERSFRWLLNEDAMATEKLSEGIRWFAADARRLESHLE